MTVQPLGPGGSDAGPSEVDAVFRALADENRRQVLRYIQTGDTAVASVAELIDYTVERGETPIDRDRLEVEFHHATLPQLAEAGVIDYDARTRTVRYRGGPLLEQFLNLVTDGTVTPS